MLKSTFGGQPRRVTRPSSFAPSRIPNRRSPTTSPEECPTIEDAVTAQLPCRLAHTDHGGAVDQDPDIVARKVGWKDEEEGLGGRKARGQPHDPLAVQEAELDNREAPHAGVTGFDAGALVVRGVARKILHKKESLEVGELNLDH